MAITKNLIVTLKDDIVELKDKMFIFRNDVGVEMIIELKDFEYSIDAIGNKNNFSKVSAIFRTPSGKLYSYNNIKVSSGKIRFVFTQDLIDVMQEIGEYELQFQLYDKLNNRLTIPSYNFYVKEPLCLPNEAIVGEGTVGFSYVAEDETYLFSIENGYIKTEWEAGDLITKGKLNKIENAIFDVVNAINNMDTTNNNPNLGNQHTHNNMGILNTITADKINQWDNKSDFDGNYNNLINKPPIPTEISDLINDVGYLTSIPSEYVTDSELNSKGYLTEHQDVYWDAIIGKPTTFEPSSHNHSINDISDFPNDLATKDYVEDAINNAKLEGGDVQVDLSTYAKKTDLHDHSNKLVLDNITTSKVNQWDNKSDFSGDYNDLTNKPTIPTKTSQLTNDIGYITEHQDISGKVDKVNGYSLVSDSEISRLATLKNYNDTEVRELINETNTSLDNLESEVNELKEGNIQIDLTNYATKDYVEDAINNAKLEGGDTQVDLSVYAKKTDLHSHSNKTILDSITTSKVNQWDNKSDFSGNYNDLTNKPTIPTKVSELTNDESYLTSIPSEYITESELNSKGYLTQHQDISGKVDKVIGKSLISDSEIERLSTLNNYDDTDIKNTLNSKANKTDLHSHTNKTVLDNISSAKVTEWDNKSTFSGNYNDLTNKPTIPSLNGYATEQYVNEEIKKIDVTEQLTDYAKKSELHSHTNKTVLDGITSAKITEWDNKSTFDGDYNSLTNKPTIPTKMSELTNDEGYLTSIPSEYVTDSELNSKGYLTEHQDISGKVDKINGYSLVSDSEISRLATLENYDDTEIRELINEINASLDNIERKIEGLEQSGNLVVSDVEEGELFEIDDGKPIVSVTGVTLNKSTTIVPKGSTETLTVTIKPSNATDKSVTWSSSNDSIATVNNGVVTGVADGNCNIIVTTVDGNYTATCGVTVETVNIPVQSITLNISSYTFKVDETIQLTPTFNPSNATNKNVTWSSNNENCTVVDGLVTGKVEGESVITCTSVDGNHTATCTITVDAKTDVPDEPEVQNDVIYEEDGYLCVPVEMLTFSEVTAYSRDNYKVYQIKEFIFTAPHTLLDKSADIDTILKDINISKGTWNDVITESKLTEMYAIKENSYIAFKILTSNLVDKTIHQYFKDVVCGDYLKFKLKSSVIKFILDETQLSNFAIKTADRYPNAQYCRFSYPSVPTIDKVYDFNSWGYTLNNNTIYNSTVRSIGLHPTNKFIEFLFDPNTFTEFNSDNVKEYIRNNKLIIWTLGV